MYLAASETTSCPSAGAEGGGEGELIGEVVREHASEEAEAIIVMAVLSEPGKEGGPRDEVAAGHFLEHAAGKVEAAALGIHVEKVVGDEEVGRPREKGEHAAVEASAEK